jgi:hypothetical protein
MAMDSKTGKIVWWYQNVVRDMIEGDSSWSAVLAKLAIGGQERKVVIKHTTTGLIWANDAASGEALWLWEPPTLRSRVDPDGAVRGKTACSPKVGADPLTQDGYWNDIRSHFDMQEKKWLNYPAKDSFCWNPGRAGESDVALDTGRNTIYVQIGLGTDLRQQAGPCETRVQACNIPVAPLASPPPQNVTVYAVDATTGKEKWSYFIPGTSVRGGTITSGGVVYVSSALGFYYALDADTGKLLNKIFLGVAVVTQATIGKTADGKSVLLLRSGGGGGVGLLGLLAGAASGPVPGALIAYGLPDKVPQPADIAREALKEVPKEQLKEVLQDIPKEALPQVAPSAETISPISYGIVGVGIVLIVISGILFSRRKKA